MARPSKLTKELIDTITLAIRAGNDKKVAAQLAGISESTYYSWLEQAKEPDAEPELLEFLESVEQAEAYAEVMRITRITQAADNGTWQAAAWWLERKHSERWGRNDKLRTEISGPNGQPIRIATTADEDARKAILEFLNEGSKDDDFISIREDKPEITN